MFLYDLIGGRPVSLQFVDRLNVVEELETHKGDRIADVLRRNFIPCSSVLVTRDDVVVSDAHLITPGATYEARLIEGYDIGRIRKAIADTLATDQNSAFVKRRLLPDTDGALDIESVPMSGEALGAHVVDAIVDTIQIYDLIQSGDRLLVGLSGGVDSSSLLLALSDAKPHLPDFDLIAVTFEDYDSVDQPTYIHARRLSNELGIEHHIVPATRVEEVFGVNKPLRQILPGLMKSKYAPMTMYVDHHTTRRALELFAEENDIGCIALGLHTTDLLAGILNSLATGYTVASLPLRRVGKVDYIYPLAFTSKRELHIYHQYKTGTLARHSVPNEWERNPLDRNFYYFLADTLQEYWPGLETFIFSSHNWRLRRDQPVRTEVCSNCGGTLVVQPFMSTGRGECEVCQVLKEAGYR